MLEALQYEFMRNAQFAGLLASVACGIVGVYVVVKRIVFISGGIAHASFGGIGLGYLAGISPVLGAMFFTLASALGMGLVTRRTKLPEDTAIGILWAMGMAMGIIFIGLTPGYAPDLFSYLFGNILTVPRSGLILMLALDAIIVTIVGGSARRAIVPPPAVHDRSDRGCADTGGWRHPGHSPSHHSRRSGKAVHS